MVVLFVSCADIQCFSFRISMRKMRVQISEYFFNYQYLHAYFQNENRPVTKIFLPGALIPLAKTRYCKSMMLSIPACKVK